MQSMDWEQKVCFFFFFFITLGLELSDTKVYEPQIRALIGTAYHYCEAVVLASRPVPTLD